MNNQISSQSPKLPFFYRYLPIILGAIIIILITGGIFAWQYLVPEEESKSPEVKIQEEARRKETATWKTYRNEEYGYEFKYPQDYFLKEVLIGSFLLLREAEGGETNWLIEIYSPRKWTDGYLKEIESFKEYAVNVIRGMCAADGPLASVYCTDLVKQEIFINTQGIRGYKIYIIEVTESYKEGETEISERTRGPIFAFDISQQTDLARGIFFKPTRLKEESIEKGDLLKIFNQMLSTFKFLE